MQRCAPPARRRAIAATALCAASLMLATGAVQAQQMRRPFPATALRGEIAVQQPPALLLNGRPARLAPGARIRGADNLMMTTAMLAGQRLTVHYTLDNAGELAEIWLLTAAERARVPWPATPEQAATWRFDPLAQTWTRP